MDRRTKIVCTLGPASDSEETIRALIRAGMDVARLNFSHGTHDYHRQIMERVRSASRAEGRDVAILQDLQGPKIRIGEVEGGGIDLVAGHSIRLTSQVLATSTCDVLHVSYDTLADDLSVGGEILIDDGNIELKVVGFDGRDVRAEVVTGGRLSSRKGVNLPNIRTSTPALTDKDLADLEFGLSQGVDIIALSFVREASDVKQLADRVRSQGSNVLIIAKIEKPEAVECIDEILATADGIMVARGDLGIEMRLSKVPGAQKSIIAKCLAAAKPAITATQMLESMIDNPRPTRAEVSDVANAVLDGSDAVMLSGETAMGSYPVRAVEVMRNIIVETEKTYLALHALDPTGDTVDVTEAVSRSAYWMAAKVGAKAITCLTASGATARAIARHRPHVPVYAFTDDHRVVGQLALSWGTKAFFIPFQCDTDEGISLVHDMLMDMGLAREGDRIVVTAGMPLPAKDRTNMVHISTL
ncbi:MAG: pyruvate kinase [Bacteroidetes bacterium CG12_big_fil_rev_8_21_14_0_65_60_17]|nr:MAG: pyruvate kinase [Bacteroidetes bacterium CG12_big_fil_rev_8_21_14_0_65_60_17]